jgi:hypothetical protein
VTSPSTAPRWPARVLLAGTAAIGVLTVFTVTRYPGTLHDPAAPVYLVLLGVVLAGYVGAAGWGLRRRLVGQAGGVLLGLVAGALWSIEIWAGGPAMLGHATEKIVGGTFALLAVGVTVAAGVGVGGRRRDRGAAVRAGLFAGLTSGVVVFLAGTVMTLASLHTLGTRTDYQQQFAGSHAADMATFLVGDILAAVTAHLVINLLLGLLGGGIGAILVSSLGHADRVAAPETLAPGPQ